MEVRFTVTDDEFMGNLQKDLQVKTTPEVVKQALTLLNWAIGEVSRNRIILSSDLDGRNVHRLVMPALAKVRKMETADSGSQNSTAPMPVVNAR